MANYRSTRDLKVEVLKKCGELTDGTSDYDSDVLTYINNCYQGVLSGGNEFGVDCGEPWAWALAPKPLVLTLQPAYTTGTVTVTNNSLACTFSNPPTTSMVGRFLKVESRPEYFAITTHIAGQAAFNIDQPYTEASGTQLFKAIQLDYLLSDDTIVIDFTNRLFTILDLGQTLNIIIPVGVYTPATLATTVSSTITAAGPHQAYFCGYSPTVRGFGFSAPSPFSLNFNNVGSPTTATLINATEGGAAKVFGFDKINYTGANGYNSIYQLNTINRLTSPMLTYRLTDFMYRGSAKDEGKIFEVDYNTYTREFPLTRLCQEIPTKFATIKNVSGQVTVRFNAYPGVVTRVEVPYIPVFQDLQDNDADFPAIPRGFRDYLVHAAAYYILTDKSDNKADNELKLAMAKLQALINHNRKELSLAGNNYGKLIPRRQGHCRFRTY